MIVSLPQGRLRGHWRNGVLRFDGIPYAAPPLGDLRFAPPQSPEVWSGVRDGQPRPAPLQRAGAMLGARPVADTSENCLHLNVVTPDTRGRRPVMVWIYGGGFVNGSAADPIHEGERLVAAGDVVLVTFDYRLGAFGFLDTEAGSNIGIRDQLAALCWVRDHIDRFGGNPESITLFGESAGGMSVLTLMGCPAADELFHRAVVQSGAANWLASPDEAMTSRRLLAEQLGSDDLDHWRRLAPEQLLDAQQQVQAQQRQRTGRGAFRPMLDGRLIQADGLSAQARPANQRRPLLVGTNADEQRLFLNMRRLAREHTVKRLARALQPHTAAPEAAATALLEGYRQRLAEGSENLWLAAAETALHYRVPLLRLLHARAGAVSWHYRFDWCSPALRGRLGACHALEVPFVFGTLDAPGMARFAGDGPDAWHLAQHMIAIWSHFARHSHPRGEAPDWQPWRADARLLWRLDRHSHADPHPDADEKALWNAVVPGLYP